MSKNVANFFLFRAWKSRLLNFNTCSIVDFHFLPLTAAFIIFLTTNSTQMWKKIWFTKQQEVKDESKKLLCNYVIFKPTATTPPDKDIIEALSQHAREVLVVNGVEELWLVQVAAEGVSNAGVSQGTEGTVQLQSVVMELSQVFMLR